MAREARIINISEIQSSIDLPRLAEEVRNTNERIVLRANGEDLVELTPLSRKTKESTKARPVAKDDALFRLIGIGRSGISEGVARNKHKYLAKAYADKHL